jgi:hypothetical protein
VEDSAEVRDRYKEVRGQQQSHDDARLYMESRNKSAAVRDKQALSMSITTVNRVRSDRLLRRSGSEGEGGQNIR